MTSYWELVNNFNISADFANERSTEAISGSVRCVISFYGTFTFKIFFKMYD